MDTNSLFLNASRYKYHFESTKGLNPLSVEDLWDLPLTGKGANLDEIGLGLRRKLKEANEETSLVRPVVKSTEELQAKFEIVKTIIDIKVADRDAASAAKARSETVQELREALKRKKAAAVENLSEADLEAKLASLQAQA